MDEQSYWCERFYKLQGDLFQHVVQQRASAVAESLLRLFDNLFEVLEGQLTGIWEDYEKERSLLEEVIRDIDDFGQEQKAKSKKQFASIKSRVRTNTKSVALDQAEKAMNSIERAIYKASDVEELKKVSEKKVEKQLKKAVNAIRNSVKESHEEVQQEASEFNAEFDKAFKKLYSKLRLISQNKISNISSGAQSLQHDEYDSLIYSSAVEEGAGFGKAVAGGTIGFLIGNVFLPGIGGVAGAWLGAKASKWFGPSIEERQDQFWNELRPLLRENFDQIKSKATKLAEKDVNKISKAINRRIQDHVNKYQDQVDRTADEQNRRRKEIEKLQKEIREIMNELKLRRKKVKQQQINLRPPLT